MTESEYLERLRAAGIPPGSYRVEDTPPELTKVLIAALDRLINEKDNADES